MKNILAPALLLLFLITPLQVDARGTLPAAEDGVQVRIEHKSADPLSTFNVPVTLDTQGNPAPAALNLDVSFDSAALELETVTASEQILNNAEKIGRLNRDGCQSVNPAQP